MTFATEFKKDMTKAKAENKKFDASVFKAMGGEQKSDVKKVDNPNPTSHM
jgi:hypothetical protein